MSSPKPHCFFFAPIFHSTHLFLKLKLKLKQQHYFITITLSIESYNILCERWSALCNGVKIKIKIKTKGCTWLGTRENESDTVFNWRGTICNSSSSCSSMSLLSLHSVQVGEVCMSHSHWLASYCDRIVWLDMRWFYHYYPPLVSKIKNNTLTKYYSQACSCNDHWISLHYIKREWDENESAITPRDW